MLPGPAKKQPTRKTGSQNIGREDSTNQLWKLDVVCAKMLIKLRYRHSRRYACHINIYKTLTNQQRIFVICLHNISLSIPYSLCDVSPEIALINWLIFKSDGDSLSMSTISLLLIFYSSLLNCTQSVSCILKASCHEILPPTSVLSNKVVIIKHTTTWFKKEN